MRRATPVNIHIGRYDFRPRRSNNNRVIMVNEQQQAQQQMQPQAPQQMQQPAQQQIQPQAQQVQQPAQQQMQQLDAQQQVQPQFQQLQIQQQQQQHVQQIVPNHQRGHINLKPPKFNGTPQENGWYWLEKFIAYCHRAGIDINDDEAMLENFMLSINGSAETWFMLLPHDQRQTFDQLQNAFLKRYDSPQNNYGELDTFYSRKQQPAEAVATYIDEMMNFGAKLHINISDIIATIKRGLLDHIRMQVMMTNTENPQDLLQKATLAESFHARATQPHVHFSTNNTQYTQQSPGLNELQHTATELRHLVGSLSQHLDKVNVNSLASQNRSRSPTPHRQLIQQDMLIGTTQGEPMCSYCNSLGHNYQNCRLRELSMSQRQSYTPRFQQARGDMQRQGPRQYFGPPRTFAPQQGYGRFNYTQPSNRGFYPRNYSDTNTNRRFYNNNNYNYRQHLN